MSKIVILIGKTGSGKSTLANVISGTSKFKESSGSVSETKEIQKEEFSINENGNDKSINYAVIDTVGIGDTQLKKEEVLDKIAEAVYLAREGVSQILFVTNGRFDQFEMATYNLLRTIIFDEYITNHTTIVRTRFEDFENKGKCKADIEKMLTEKELSEIVSSCQERIVHVNNSSLNSKYGKEEREESRRKVLEHLWEKCQNQENYKPQKLQELSAKIFEYMEEKMRKRKELAEKEKAKKALEKLKEETKKKEETEVINEQVSENEDSENESDKILKKGSKSKIKAWTTFSSLKKGFRKKGKKAENNQESEDEKNNLEILSAKSKITALENKLKELKETKKLIEEIQAADGAIRQRVLKHIFNNYNEITQVTGGNVFLNSIVGNNNNFYTANKLSFTELKEKVEELERELQEKGNDDQSLEQIKTELGKKEKELIELKKWQLLNDEEITKKWLDHGFNIQQAQDWVEAGFSTSEYKEVQEWKSHNFTPARTKEWLTNYLQTNEYEFANHLKKQGYQPNTPNIKEIIKEEAWQDVHYDFTYSDRKKWQNRGFNKEQTKEWKGALVSSFSPENDAEFCVWLRDNKQIMTERLSNEEVKQLRGEYIQKLGKKGIRNILLVGQAGSGKSALANVLVGTKEFEEGAVSISVTQDIKAKKFEENGIKYNVIDTPGIDNTNTNLSKEEVLKKIKKGIDLAKGEISQILFLVKDGNFSEGGKEIFKLLEIILENDVANCVTIVRTHFTNFEDEEECKNDREFLIEEIKKASGSFSSCKVIHIDNPSLVGHSVEENKRTRKVSRTKLLEYLQKNCQESYKLDSTKIDDYIKEVFDSTNSSNQPGIGEEPQPSIEFITWFKDHIRVN